MALQCLVIVGKLNEPLFLLEVPSPPGEEEKSSKDDEKNDIFGFLEVGKDAGFSIRHEVCVSV